MSEEIDDLLGLSSVGDALKSVQNVKKVRVKRKAPKFPRKWTAGQDYELFSEGIVLKKSPDKLADKLGPQCLYLFRHVRDEQDEDVVGFGEDRDRPLWIGVLKPHNYPDDVYYTPTQDQEKVIYRERPVKDMPRNFHLDSGHPYWVDSYYHKKGREKKNKTRHTKKLNAKKKRSRLVGDENQVVISGGLPIDGKTFFFAEGKVLKTLENGDWLEVRKVARKTMATSNLAKKIPKDAPCLLEAMLSGSRAEGGPPAKKKKKTARDYQEEVKAKQVGSDFTAARWLGPIPIEEMPEEVIEYINEQYEHTKRGHRGQVSDALWANFSDYSNTKVPTQRVASNSTGDLLLNYHTFLKRRKTK